MVKRDLIERTAAAMRERNIRKSITVPGHTFHISDDEGNRKDFKVRQTDKSVLFTKEDVAAVIEACMDVIQEAVRTGEEVSIHGFGKLGLKYRKPRTVTNVLDGSPVDAPGGYVPRFISGNELIRCAQLYTQSIEDRKINDPLPVFTEEDGE